MLDMNIDINKQKILMYSYIIERHNLSKEQLINKILEALRCTIDLKKPHPDKHPFTDTEVNILAHMANIYYKNKEYDKAEEIELFLINYLTDNNAKYHYKVYILLLSNYIKTLVKINKDYDVQYYVKEGVKTDILCGKGRMCSDFLNVLANDTQEKIPLDETLSLYKNAFWFALLFHNEANASISKNNYILLANEDLLFNE